MQRKLIALAGLILIQSVALAQDSLQISLPDRLKVFDKAWVTVNQYFFDPKFNGVNWAEMKQKYRPLAERATDKAQLVGLLQQMLNELHASHSSIRGDYQSFPFGTGTSYLQIEGKPIVSRVAPDSPAQLAGLYLCLHKSYLPTCLCR